MVGLQWIFAATPVAAVSGDSTPVSEGISPEMAESERRAGNHEERARRSRPHSFPPSLPVCLAFSLRSPSRRASKIPRSDRGIRRRLVLRRHCAYASRATFCPDTRHGRDPTAARPRGSRRGSGRARSTRCLCALPTGRGESMIRLCRCRPTNGPRVSRSERCTHWARPSRRARAGSARRRNRGRGS